ncbi:hypothetical protein KZ810_02630 [Sphingomonas sp. RHCKR47]|uniref:hypothetical protein n=1 Tax=Sphingomonas citricola TaxID=2862498 RepID=UPI001CA56365|nr:hypothetical protein [Sphingomonas citricola]MBW6522383.1 hypothetical protein [Sphingomonas citricola]
MADARAVVRERAAARGLSFAALSRLIGRHDAFVQQWLVRRSPRKLDEDDRLRMAMALDVDEVSLGARMPWRPVIFE